MIPRVETYVECIRLDRRVRSYTQKGCFNALNQHQENGILETDFLGDTSHLRTDVVARGRGERAYGDFLLSHRWTEKKKNRNGDKNMCFL